MGTSGYPPRPATRRAPISHAAHRQGGAPCRPTWSRTTGTRPMRLVKSFSHRRLPPSSTPDGPWAIILGPSWTDSTGVSRPRGPVLRAGLSMPPGENPRSPLTRPHKSPGGGHNTSTPRVHKPGLRPPRPRPGASRLRSPNAVLVPQFPSKSNRLWIPRPCIISEAKVRTLLATAREGVRPHRDAVHSPWRAGREGVRGLRRTAREVRRGHLPPAA